MRISDCLSVVFAKSLEIWTNIDDRIDQMDYDDDNLYFIFKNCFNSIVNSTIPNLQKYDNDFMEELGSDKQLFLIFLCISIAYQIVGQCALTKLFQQITDLSKNNIKVFLWLPESYVRRYYNAAENVIASLSEGDEANIDSDDEENNQNLSPSDKINLENQASSDLGRRKRKFKNTSQPRLTNPINGLYLFGITVIGYCLINLLIVQIFFNNMIGLVPEHTMISVYPGSFNFVIGALRNLFLNPEMTISYYPSYLTVLFRMNHIYNITQTYYSDHLMNININTEEFLDKFDNVFYRNFTDINSTIQDTNCSNMLMGIGQKGLGITISRVFDIEELYIKMYLGGVMTGNQILLDD